MGQINVTIGARSYPLACRDGEEARLERLASHIASKAEELTGSLGQMSEPRLLLMSALLVTDELFEVREKGGGGADHHLEMAAARIEQLADALERGAVAT